MSRQTSSAENNICQEISDLIRLVDERSEQLRRQELMGEFTSDAAKINPENRLSEQEISSSALYHKPTCSDSRNLSGISENIDIESRNLSRISENIDNDSRNLSGISENIDSESRNLSGISENMDSESRNLSGISENKDIESRNLSGFSEKENSESRNLSGISENIDIESRNLSGISENKDNMHEMYDASREATFAYELEKLPILISAIDEPFKQPENFTKGCKWSPDGLCILTCSDDTRLRIFDTSTDFLTAAADSCRQLPAVSPAAAVCCLTGELVYDYCWYPLMNSLDPVSCCVASSSRDHPVHLYDAFTGQLRATYRAYNSVDEIAAACSVGFDAAGEKLYAGFDGWIAEFPVSSPGRQLVTRSLKDKHSAASLSGIVSCFAFSSLMPSIHAVATYRRSIGIFNCGDTRRPLCILDGQAAGVTHLCFSPDSTKLISGGRRDNEILCWDMRHLGRILCTMRRTVDTNQRVYFDIGAHDASQQLLFSGDSGGEVRVWDLNRLEEAATDCGVLGEKAAFVAHNDCCNGVSCHPYLPVLATSSGQRHHHHHHGSVNDTSSSSSSLSSSSDGDVDCHQENSVKLWWLGDRRSSSLSPSLSSS